MEIKYEDGDIVVLNNDYDVADGCRWFTADVEYRVEMYEGIPVILSDNSHISVALDVMLLNDSSLVVTIINKEFIGNFEYAMEVCKYG